MSNEMALSAGTRIGSYEIVALLGVGGMGEVYRARDTKLNRDVAIKVLLAAVANDVERLARFNREAQLIASINHPHIAQVHGLEDAGNIRALVMEMVEGQTLADRIALGAIPVDEALPIAKQIAEALEAAHELGIIHRDLKPANIKVKTDGTVKVLDFGLAKALDPANGDAANSPTLSMQATAAGVILGTAAYMAPEQARGKAVDKRADIWAFGCVLFEMLTRRRAFHGDDVTDTIVAIVSKEPDWTAVPSAAAGLRPLLVRCLRKDRKQRLQSIGDARVQIEEHIAGHSEEAVAIRPPAAMPSRRAIAGTLAALAGAASIAALATWGLTRQPTMPAPQVSRFEIVPIAEQSLAAGSDRDIAISPDGRYVAYRGGQGGSQLILRPIDSVEARVMPSGTNVRQPFFSPDSQWIGFFEGNTLKKVSVAGGAAINIATTLAVSRGASWGADDRIVFATTDLAKGLLSVPASGGESTILTTPDPSQGATSHWYPAVLPAGRGVLFTLTSRDAATTARLAVLDLRTGTYKSLIRGSQAEYVPGGYLLYVADSTLHAVRFDLETLELIGNPIPVVEGVSTRGGGAANYGVSAAGTLVYMPQESRSPQSLVWVDRQGKETPIPLPPDFYDGPRLSPDGKRVAVTVRDLESDIYIVDLDGGSNRRLTFEDGHDAGPVWTPDGKRIVFRSARGGLSGANLYIQNADGTGVAERLTTSPYWQSPSFVAQDGTSVLGFESANATSGDILRIPLGARPTSQPEVLIQTPAFENNPEISPDGHYIAYQSNESGRPEIYVRPFPKLDGRFQVSSGGGRAPAWRRNGRELYYLDATNRLMAVPVQLQASTAGFTYGNPVRLFDTAYVAALSGTRGYDVSADGQRFLMVREQSAAAATPLRLIVALNWFEELKTKLAAK